MKLIVLMSTYNGEKYLREQLDSLVNQLLKPDKILIRDDGSKDETINILEEYRRKYKNIEYYSGNNKGPAKSFFELINKAEGYDYYALCDQDDVWFKDKLSVAVEKLEKEGNNKPLLYAGRFVLTDKDLKPLNSNISKLYSYNDFAHALAYHTAPGCTFVFNNEARKQIIKYDLEREYRVIHDAIIHKVVTLFGKMVLDNEPYMYYRQHGNNEIGLTANKIKIITNRIKNVFSGRLKNYRSDIAKSLLNVYGENCDEYKKELLILFAYYRTNREYKKKLIKCKEIKTNSINDLIFIFLVLVNYI